MNKALLSLGLGEARQGEGHRERRIFIGTTRASVPLPAKLCVLPKNTSVRDESDM